MIKHKYEPRTDIFEKCGSLGACLYLEDVSQEYEDTDNYYSVLEFPEGIEVDYGQVKETYYSFVLYQNLNTEVVEIEEYTTINGAANAFALKLNGIIK